MEQTEKIDTYHHGNLGAALVEAALSLVLEKGADAVTIREVARRAGVSHTAPYRHFADKQALMATVAKQGFDLMVSRMRQRMAAYPDDPLLRFKNCGIAYIEFAVAHPAHYRVMFGPGGERGRASDALKDSAAEAFRTLFDSITDCQTQGLVKPGDAMEMALAAWSIVHGFSMLFIDQHVKDTVYYDKKLERMMDVVTDSLYFGLRSVDGPASGRHAKDR